MKPDSKAEPPTKGAKPYPWGCANCRADEVYPTIIPYTIDVNHDGRSYSIAIPQFEVARCRQCGELTFSNSADDQIDNALRAHLHLLTAEQIRAKRTELGLSQEALAERLGVAEATIARWETGALIQSRAMDNLLRLYFAFPEVRSVLLGPEQNPALGVEALSTAGTPGA